MPEDNDDTQSKTDGGRSSQRQRLTNRWRVPNLNSESEWRYAALVYLVVTTLLTWPLLLRPDRIHLAAPSEYTYVQAEAEWGLQWYLEHGSRGREVVDHNLFLRTLREAAASIQSYQAPTLIQPEITIPPTYVLTGAVTTSVLPFQATIFHTLFFVGSLFLAGLFTFLLVREIFEDPEVALLAGILYMSSFYLFYEYTMGHANQWQIQWIPLILYGLERIRVERSVRSISLLGIAGGLQALSSEQYTIYLTFLVPLYVALRYVMGAIEYRRLTFWTGLSAASVIALLLSGPYVVSRVLLARGGATEVRSLETNTYHWYTIDPTNIAGVAFAFDVPLQFLFRLALLFLGAVGLVTASRQNQRRSLPFALLFVVGLALSWGPIAPWAPYTFVYQYWPFVEYFRTPYRVLPIALLGSSTLSASMLLQVKRDSGWTKTGALLIAVLSSIQIAIVHYSLQFTSYQF